MRSLQVARHKKTTVVENNVLYPENLGNIPVIVSGVIIDLHEREVVELWKKDRSVNRKAGMTSM